MLLSELSSLEFGKVITAFLKQRCKGNMKIKKKVATKSDGHILYELLLMFPQLK